MALRVTRFSLFEAHDGGSIVVSLAHGESDATHVHLTNEAAQLLVQHARNRLAFRDAD